MPELGGTGSSKTAFSIFNFSIVLGAKYLFYVKSIATYAPTFLGYNDLVLAVVHPLLQAHPNWVGRIYLPWLE